MTNPAQAELINGHGHALRVQRDRRGRIQRCDLLRKRDQRTLASLHPSAPTRVHSVARKPLTRAAAAELAQLRRRLRPGPTDRLAPTAGDQITRVQTLLARLGLGVAIRNYRPPRCPEPKRLLLAGHDRYGRALWLIPAAAHAWQRLCVAARADGITLQAVSGYRSADYQAALIARKLEQGQSPEQILQVSALPGHSEHHLGSTLDLHAGSGPVLDESFEGTAAFAWLQLHADHYGFRLSYPRGNLWGIAYEPWHWRFHPPGG